MKGTQMHPTKDRILVRLDERNDVSASGIIIKKAWEDARRDGTAEAVGKNVEEIKVGDKVLINPYAVLETADEDLVFVRESDVLSYER